MSSRYDPLASRLRSEMGPTIRMTFRDIDRIVGGLPNAAKKHRAWWSNSTAFTHARHGWLAVGWKASEVNMDEGHLVFLRTIDRASDNPALGNSKLNDHSAVVEAIEHYVAGQITETELGRIIRKHWPRTK